MARILIKVEKDDVNTSKLGNNIMVQCNDNIDLIFTPEALQELIGDYNNIAVGGLLPSVDEAGIMAVGLSEKVEPKLTVQEQAFYIAGFCECIKWLGSNDR